MEKVCILGGGASALMCACFATGNVTIIEQNDKAGKKILATGNGRCNLTNKNYKSGVYNQNIDKFLNKFDYLSVLKFFKSIGLETYFDEEGRCYPLSNSSSSVVDVLKNYLQTKNNVKFVCEKKVNKIEKNENGYNICFEDETKEFFEKVVVATGNYTNLSIFDDLNIKYNQFVPSLCSLKTTIKNKSLSGLRVSGVKVSCNLKNYNFEEIGEILFKDEGVSGIVIFNLSSHMARENNFKYDFFVDYLPKLSTKEIEQNLKNRRESLKNLTCIDFLTGFFHKSLNFELLKLCKIDLNKSVKNITDIEIKNLCYLIKNYKISACGHYDNNQVACGGVTLGQLFDNLESKKNKNLFFIGEVVDVDGVCGGYNLQWAWTSGKIVGECLWN